MLVPMSDEMASWIKRTAVANGVTSPAVVRLILVRGIQAIGENPGTLLLASTTAPKK
jgi:hypothetical protein